MREFDGEERSEKGKKGVGEEDDRSRGEGNKGKRK
jgi:hypothetical protein